MTRARWAIAVICVNVAIAGARGAAADPTYQRFFWRTFSNSCGASGSTHSIPCCSVDGWDSSGSEAAHPTCPTLFDVGIQIFSCATDQKVAELAGTLATSCCGCGDPTNACRSGNDPTLVPDGAVSPGNYQCNGNSTSTEPEQCDGLANSITYGAVPADKGCGSDENHCDLGDSDPAPVRYSSGRVESNPIALFRVPAPDDIFFGYLIKYNSYVVRTPAQRTVSTTIIP